VNRRPTPFFLIKRGLRQGFPFSPLIYIIMEKSFRKMIDNERVARNLHGILIVKGTEKINHSWSIDETFLMGGALSIIVERSSIFWISL
jgi:hypothetical protein